MTGGHHGCMLTNLERLTTTTLAAELKKVDPPTSKNEIEANHEVPPSFKMAFTGNGSWKKIQKISRDATLFGSHSIQFSSVYHQRCPRSEK